MRATMLMAACVLAVAVPTVLVATRGDVDKPVTPAQQQKVDGSPLTLAGLERGKDPRTGYVLDDTWVLDGKAVDLTATGPVRAVARLGSRLLVETSTVEGPLRAAVVPTPPEMVGQETSWPVEGGLAVSDDGSLAAFVQPDGTPVVVQDDGQVTFELPRITSGGPFDAVAVTGGDCKRAAEADCTVWVEGDGQEARVWTSTLGGAVDTARPDLLSVSDLFGVEQIAGKTSVTDDGSCSMVLGPDGPAWSTCEHQLGSFSPDGDHLAAFAAYFDGAGSSELAVLDAATGTVVLDLHTAQDAFVSQVVWEDDSHLLAVVGEGRQAAILRIGLDGVREYAVPPTKSRPYEPPFVLPSR
jgi:hypothetical protein